MSNKTTKPITATTIICIIIAIAFMPILALVEAHFLSKVWAMFVAAQYGAGPALGTWYGLTAIAQIPIAFTVVGLKQNDHTDSDPGVVALAKQLGMMLGLAMLYLQLYVIGSLFGWVA